MANEIAKLFVTLGLDDKDFQQSLKRVEKSLTSLAKPMAVLGAAITAGFGFAVKAAEEERVSIAQLSAVMDNARGVFADSTEEVEKLIAAQQRQTGISDGAQREAMSALIVTTKDFQKSMSLLPLALDLAAAKQMDVATAAELVGRVAEGNTSVLTRYGIQLRAGATASEALAELQSRVGGTAAAMASPIDIARNSLSDLQEVIGAAVLPAVGRMAEKFVVIIENITAWAQANPGLVEGIAKFGGALLIIGGTILGVVRAIQAVNIALAIMHGLAGPAGWAALAAGAAIAGGAIVGMNALMNDAMSGINTGTSGATRSFAAGGIVPGPPGAPVPVIAHGGEAFAGVGRSFGGDTVNVTINGWVGSDQQIARKVREQFLQIKRQAFDTGV